MTASFAIALLAVPVVRCGKPSASKERPLPTTEICDVIASPSRFVGKTISFRGRFFSDCHHGSILNASPCPYHGISAYTDQSMRKGKQDLLNNGVCPPFPRDPHGSDATALFTGVVIHVDRTKRPLLFQPEFELAITDFSDMRIVKRRLPSDESGSDLRTSPFPRDRRRKPF
jgi:hypothetical protein